MNISMHYDSLTPRRALIVAGLVFLALGVVGLFVDWDSSGPFRLSTGKIIALLMIGAAFEWVAEVLTSETKRPFTKFFAVVLTVAGIVGLFVQDWGVTTIAAPWEALTYLALGVLLGLSAWLPRRFHDYEWATGWSSGLEGSSRVTTYR
ncbi:MAG: hypothetical protein FJ318_06820 [SAR202 cluster bacterium]|nr:hypothetical protein [SAR202 cluster bacterium]